MRREEKRSPFALVLILGLALGMAACDLEKPEEHPDYSDPATWFGTYMFEGTLSSIPTWREEISITAGKFYVEDFDDSKTEAERRTGDFIDVTITQWNKATTPQEYEENYPHAFKITGYLNDQKGYEGVSIANTGDGKAEVEDNITFYLYFDDVNKILMLVRTQITKAGVSNQSMTPIKDANTVRAYRIKTVTAN